MLAAVIGAGVMLFIAAVPFFVAWGNLHARVRVLEAGFAELGKVQEDVAYMRGKIDGIERFLIDLSGWFQSPPPIIPASRKPRP